MSEAYEEKRDSLDAVAAWTVKIVFPTFHAIPTKTFRWATTPMEVDGEDYGQKEKDRLVGVPNGQHQADRGGDSAKFSAANPNNELYDEFYAYEDLIERAEVTIKECYEIEIGYWESEVRFFGYLKDFDLDEGEKVLNFTAMSDLSRTGFLVGGRILTRERCGWAFNYNGLLSPLIDPCGWQTIQGGNLVFCSKYEKGVDGCESHNNTHRFGAIKGLSDAEVQLITGNATGFNYHTGATCFIAGTYVLMADWTLKPIERIVPGTDYVMGFDVFTDELVPAKVLNRFKHRVTEYEDALFTRQNKARHFGIRREHLLYFGNGNFKPYGSTIGSKVQGLTKDKKRAQINSIQSETVLGEVDVYNLWTECGTFHISDAEMEIIVKCHNLKSATTVN